MGQRLREEFFATVKAELLQGRCYRTRKARAAIFEFIEVCYNRQVWYNGQRPPSSLGYRRPRSTDPAGWMT